MGETGEKLHYSRDISGGATTGRAERPASGGKFRHRVCQFWVGFPGWARTPGVLGDDPASVSDGIQRLPKCENPALLDEREQAHQDLGRGQGIA